MVGCVSIFFEKYNRNITIFDCITKLKNVKNTFYIIGLILILASILLLISFPDSNRMSLISGMILPIGLTFNVLGFVLKPKLDKNLN